LAKFTAFALPRRAVHAAATVGLAAILLTNLALLVKHHQRLARTGYPCVKLTHPVVEWSSYERVFLWLEDHRSTGDVVASGLDSMIHLYTDAKGFRPFLYRPDVLFYERAPKKLVSVDELAALLRHYNVRYVVQVPMPGFAEESQLREAVRELATRYPDWLVQVYMGEDPRFVIYEARPACQPADPSPKQGSGPLTLSFQRCPIGGRDPAGSG
jgi:hypothetical protein